MTDLPSSEQRPSGYLLDELKLYAEDDAAVADVAPKTLIAWRKAGLGPSHIIIAQKIFYAESEIARWVLAGGTREAEIEQKPRFGSPKRYREISPLARRKANTGQPEKLRKRHLAEKDPQQR